MDSIFIPPVRQEMYSRSDLEPQLITSRKPNKAAIYFDSEDMLLETNKVDIVMSTVKYIGDTPGQLASAIKRIELDSSGINYVSPNVNPRNNTITFFSSVTGTFFTVSIPEGFYSLQPTNNIMTALVTALNTVTGTSGLTFSFSQVPLFPTTFTLQSTGGNYFFSLSSPMIIKGYQLINLPTSQVPTNIKTVGSVGLWYTRYIDICSTTLSKYQKVKTTSTGRNHDIIFRVFLDDPTFPHVIGFFKETNVSYNFLFTEPLLTVDFELRDQNGDLLYIEDFTEGTNNGFFWDLNIIVSA